MVKRKTYFEHQCDLPGSDDYLLEIPPHLPKIQRWIRLMGRHFAVNENLPRTKKFFRSYAAIMAEKRRHFNNYPSTIHPFSTAAIFRERILFFVLMSSFVSECMDTTFGMIQKGSNGIQLALNSILFVNIFVTASTGFYDSSRKEIILCRKTIFKKKFVTYLLPEFISCMPLLTVLRAVSQMIGTDLRNSRLPLILFVKFLRWMRLGECFQYLNNFVLEMNFPEQIYSWIIVYLINSYCTLWLTCALFYIDVAVYTYNGVPENSYLRNRDPKGKIGSLIIRPHNNYLDTFATLWTIASCHFYGATEGYVPIDSELEKMLCSFILMCGYVVCIINAARLLQISGSSNISETKYEELMYQIEEYAHLKNLPDNLKKRLDIYHEYKFQRRYFKEEVILSTLSQHLRNEVILYGCRNILQKVPLFQGVMKGVIGTVLGYMRKEIYLPGDIVLKYGDPLTKMFFVSYGTLTVHYGPDVVEILHFEDGDHFGDLSITEQGGEAKLTVVALEITEVFTLSRKAVKHCSNFLKEMGNRVLKQAKDKYLLYSTLTQMMTHGDTPEDTHADTILADLRKGRILEREHWRKRP